MIFSNYLWEAEAKLIAALTYSYRNLKSEFYAEGNVRRPWQPSEMVVMMCRQLMDKKVAFKELEWNPETMQWKPRNFKYAATGAVAYSAVPDGEKKKANAILDAITEWDEDVLAKCAADEKVCAVLEAKGFSRNDKKVERELQKVQEGGFAMDLLDMDEEKLREVRTAEAIASKTTGTVEMPQTLDEYKEMMQKEIEALKAQMKSSSPKAKHKLKLEIERLESNIERAEKDAAAAAAYQGLSPMDNPPDQG